MRDSRSSASAASRTVAIAHAIRAAIGMAVSLTMLAMPMLAAPVAPDQRSGGASGQRGIGAQRGIGGQRGAARGAGRRGGRSGSATASRIQQRSYRFAETGQTIEYAVFVSTRVDAAKKSPLVIGLHGLGTPPALWLSRISDAAQNAGYIVAAPMGYTVRGWYGANGPSSGRGAVPHLGELSERDVMNVLDLVRNEFNIDERRIYLAGHSMGGAGALYLGIKHKEIWAAVAASAPAVRTQFHTPAELEQARELPMMLIQGDADRAVPVQQTRQWAEKMKALGMTYEYREIRGGTHGSTLDLGAPDMFKFFDKHVRPATERSDVSVGCDAGPQPVPDRFLTLRRHGQLNEELVKAGVMLAGDGLHPSSKASACASRSGGKRTVIDGPLRRNEGVSCTPIDPAPR